MGCGSPSPLQEVSGHDPTWWYVRAQYTLKVPENYELRTANHPYRLIFFSFPWLNGHMQTSRTSARRPQKRITGLPDAWPTPARSSWRLPKGPITTAWFRFWEVEHQGPGNRTSSFHTQSAYDKDFTALAFLCIDKDACLLPTVSAKMGWIPCPGRPAPCRATDLFPVRSRGALGDP